MSKIDEVRDAMVQALKAGDKPRKEALSLLLAALKSKAIDKREDLTEDEENTIVYKQIKEAKETLETLPADRTAMIEQNKGWIEVWSEFAPQRLGEDEIRKVVDEVLAELGIDAPTPKDKGKIMKPLMAKLGGKADGGIVNKIVTEKMS